MKKANPNNLKVGDQIIVEEAWEDVTGALHDEVAEIQSIEPDGHLDLSFPNTPDETNRLLRQMEYLAKDFKAEK